MKSIRLIHVAILILVVVLVALAFFRFSGNAKVESVKADDNNSFCNTMQLALVSRANGIPEKTTLDVTMKIAKREYGLADDSPMLGVVSRGVSSVYHLYDEKNADKAVSRKTRDECARLLSSM